MTLPAFKAVVLDIDGTLVCAGRRTVSPALVQKLCALQKAGVAVVLATGRGAFACGPAVAPGLAPDYRVCSNGALILDGDGKILFEERFTPLQMRQLLDFAEQNGLPMCFTFDDGYYDYSKDGSFIAHYVNVMGTVDCMKDGSARSRHLQGMPLGAYAVMAPREARAYGDAHPDMVLMYSFADSYDICRAGMNKAKGVWAVLQKLGLGWQDVLAVGDSENDMDMLRLAGRGVAMAGAADNVKAAADAVCPGVHEDGVLQVLESVFP